MWKNKAQLFCGQDMDPGWRDVTFYVCSQSVRVVWDVIWPYLCRQNNCKKAVKARKTSCL